MHKIMLFAGLLLLAIAAMLVNPPVQVRAAGCGFKPFPPMGCKNEDAVCICNEKGDCHWEWQCQR